jgi:FMN phosphatase YigB (HAD superfamily)
VTPDQTTIAVAFDIGGVLAADFWEAVYFAEPAGIVAKLKLDAENLQGIGADLARRYCVSAATEGAYWDDFARLVGSRPTAQQLIEAEGAVWADQSFGAAVMALRDKDVRVFVISDNTAFWSRKQLIKLGIDALLPSGDILLSWQLGIRKKSLPSGSYGVLRRLTDPAKTLVIDDRDSNLAVAARDGFQTMKYRGCLGSRIIDRLSFLL